MSENHKEGIAKLVKEYELLSKRGIQGFYEKKFFAQIIEYYEKDSQLDKALNVVEHALTMHSFSMDFYLKKAEILIDLNQEQEALEVLSHAELIAPSEVEIQLLKAEALSYVNKQQEALNILDKLRHPINKSYFSDIYFIEALVHESNEAYQQAYLSLKEAIKLNPKHEEALDRIWLIIEMQKNYKDSVQFHEAIIDMEPYSHLAWYNLGHSQAYLGNYDEAITAYEYAFIINEKFEPAYTDCAELCFELKFYNKALKFYKELLEQFEPESEVFLRIGQCYFYLEQFTSARTYFNRTVHLDAMNDEAYFYVGMCFANEEKWENATRSYQKAIQIEDEQEEYYVALGEAYLKTEAYSEAEECFRKAISLAPEESHLWIQYATFLMDTDRGTESIQILEEAEERAAGTELLYCRIACLFAIGRRQEAYYWLGEALSEDFDMHPTLFELIPSLEKDPKVVSLISTYMTQ